jgi:hypothetical protein
MIFLTDTKFQEEIEAIVSEKQLTYLDAVVHYCATNELDPEDITKLISSNLKDKIKIDAMDEGLIRKESRLPL